MKTTIWATIIENVVRKGRKETHLGPKMCTVSRWKRQFDKWHPFHAKTGGGGGWGNWCNTFSAQKVLRLGISWIWSVPANFRGVVFMNLGNGRKTVSRALFQRRELTEPHWVSGQTRWVLRKTRWVRFGTQIIGWEELTEFAPPRTRWGQKKLSELGVWNRALRNRIRPVSENQRAPNPQPNLHSPVGNEGEMTQIKHTDICSLTPA